VRAYLLHGLQHSLQVNNARYEYLKSGNMEPMQQLLCSVCSCKEESDLLKSLNMARDNPNERMEISRMRWANEVNRCQRATNHGATYPMEAWNEFVAKYGITEQRRSKHID
jgi:hypothetical protein